MGRDTKIFARQRLRGPEIISIARTSRFFVPRGEPGTFANYRIAYRGWGRAAQPLENGKGGGLELVHRIERVIVHPDHAESEGV